MQKKSRTRQPMPLLDAAIRVNRFDEVSLGYTMEMAIEEANRCLHCKNPTCEVGCPVQVPIRDFVQFLAEGDVMSAAKKMKEINRLPAICGRVCPQETQCESQCVYAKGNKIEPIAIGRLERFVADWEREHGFVAVDPPEPREEKVAIVGGGPAGLTCAGDLAAMGYKVTVFEALHAAGGVLMYGIPEFRLPKDIVQADVKRLEQMGVEFVYNVVVGRTFTIDDLLGHMGYNAVFVGTGAGLPKFMNIPGENLNGVLSANEFLTRVNLMKSYEFPEYDTPMMLGKRVAVIGAGNTAMDSVRTARRLGAERAMVVYRRTEAEMTARHEEYEHAQEEGIEFLWLTNPTEMVGNEEGWVTGLNCMKMELGEPDEGGRRRPVVVKGSEHILPVETVILALGTTPNPILLRATPDLQTNKWGCVIADPETGATTKPGVFAGGDVVTGAATVILAMSAGQKAAKAVHQYLESRKAALVGD